VVIEAGRPGVALLHNTPAALHGRPHMVEQSITEWREIRKAGDKLAEGICQAFIYGIFYNKERCGRSGQRRPQIREFVAA